MYLCISSTRQQLCPPCSQWWGEACSLFAGADVAGLRVDASMCFWPRKAAGHTEEPLVDTNKAGWKLGFA